MKLDSLVGAHAVIESQHGDIVAKNISGLNVTMDTRHRASLRVGSLNIEKASLRCGGDVRIGALSCRSTSSSNGDVGVDGTHRARITLLGRNSTLAINGIDGTLNISEDLSSVHSHKQNNNFNQQEDTVKNIHSSSGGGMNRVDLQLNQGAQDIRITSAACDSTDKSHGLDVTLHVAPSVTIDLAIDNCLKNGIDVLGGEIAVDGNALSGATDAECISLHAIVDAVDEDSKSVGTIQNGSMPTSRLQRGGSSGDRCSVVVASASKVKIVRRSWIESIKKILIS